MPLPIGATPVQFPTTLNAPTRNAAPQPYDASGRLSLAALAWIETAALEPTTNAPWASRLVSAGLFAYLNFWNAEAASARFEQVRTGAKHDQQYGPGLEAVISRLDDDGFPLHVDAFLSAPDGDPGLLDLLEHAQLQRNLPEGMVEQHPLGDGSVLAERLRALPPGRCVMLSLDGPGLSADTCNVIAVLRDSEQLWVFDVNDPKCAHGAAAESLLADRLALARRQPVLVSPPLLASAVFATA